MAKARAVMIADLEAEIKETESKLQFLNNKLHRLKATPALIVPFTVQSLVEVNCFYGEVILAGACGRVFYVDEDMEMFKVYWFIPGKNEEYIRLIREHQMWELGINIRIMEDAECQIA